jgi:F0F1-type ATP synthase alpha subunit
MDKNYQELLIEIAEKKILSDALKESLKQAILKFKQTFTQ